MIPITAITASILALIFVKLSFGIIKIRKENKILLGDGKNESLQRAIRAHGNFSEHIPITLFLIMCLELNGFYWFVTTFLVAVFIIGRILHFQGILGDEIKHQSVKKRTWAMTLTFIAILSLVVANVGWVGYSFVIS